jgi:hypothetical protein
MTVSAIPGIQAYLFTVVNSFGGDFRKFSAAIPSELSVSFYFS